MAGLIPMSRSAWFSLSTPESKKNVWFECGGRLEPDPFQADYLFAEDSEALDVQRIFNSERFLSGHLTLFHSDIIVPAAKEEVAKIDITKGILLPEQQFNELGITILQNSVDDQAFDKTHKNNHSLHLSDPEHSMKNRLRSSSKSSKNHPICEPAQTKDDRTSDCQKEESPQRLSSTPKSDYSVSSTSSKTFVNRDHRISKRSATPTQTPDIWFIREKESRQQTMGNTRDDFSEFSPQSSVASMNGDHELRHAVSEGIKLKTVPKITFVGEEKSLQKAPDSTGEGYFVSEFSSTPNEPSVFIDGNSDVHNRDVFYSSSTFDIADVEDISVPRVSLQDFIPGANGCRVDVIKRKAMLRNQQT